MRRSISVLVLLFLIAVLGVASMSHAVEAASWIDSQQVRVMYHMYKDFILEYAPYKQVDNYGNVNTTFGRTVSAASEAIRFLYYDYLETKDEADVVKIRELADYIVSIQAVSGTESGGFPSMENSTWYYTIDAVFGGYALLLAYNLTGNETYLERAVLAGDFVLRMQNVLKELYNLSYDGYAEAYESSNQAYVFKFDTRLLVALPFMKELSRVTGNSTYWDSALRAKDFLLQGLIEGYEYYDPQPYGDDAWHRVDDTFVYADTVGYAIRGLCESGFHDNATQIYEKYKTLPTNSYLWNAYLDTSSNGTKNSDYLDPIVGPSIFCVLDDAQKEARMRYYVENENYKMLMYWGVSDTNGQLINITEWRDILVVSSYIDAFVYYWQREKNSPGNKWFYDTINLVAALFAVFIAVPLIGLGYIVYLANKGFREGRIQGDVHNAIVAYGKLFLALGLIGLVMLIVLAYLSSILW